MKNVTYINASAGSGKTYTLTHKKLAELIKDKKVKPEQVIMTTFTVKAANEMKEETKKVLYEYGLFDEAEKIDQALIGTIHSVAEALIRKYWFFLGLSPDMGVMAEEDKEFYISQSLSELPTDGELQVLHGFCDNFQIKYGFGSGKTGLNYDYWKEHITKIIEYTTNYEIENYDRSIEESLGFLRQFLIPKVTLNHTEDELKAVIEEHIIFAGHQRASQKQKNVINELKRLRRGVRTPNIAWYRNLEKLLTQWNDCGDLGAKMLDELALIWHSQEVYDAEEQYIRIMFKLAERWRERFVEFKKERNLLDFNDMEKYLRDILNNEELSKEIALGYRYLFVDEYQDCSPIQVKIFDRLSELMEHSYWVGDYKQAIYGFRGSDTTLTKAVVDHIALEQDGCDVETLDTSWRSLPDIVNVCNETFLRTFDGVLNKDSIFLKTHRTNDEGISSLRYWRVDEKKGPTIADHVASMVKQGVKPNDIAILGRSNNALNMIASALNKKYGLPASRENVPIDEMMATPFVLALLALVDSEKDTLAKAQIAVLTVNNYDTNKLINDKLLWDADERNKHAEFLNEVPLVKRLLELRPMLMQQSIGSMIETMIIELDLFNAVKMLAYDVFKFDDKKKKDDEEELVIDRVAESTSCLNTFIRSGYMYEQHCLQMNIPATISGFKDYISIVKPTGAGDTYGVQLHTYHNSKGLEWKNVVLTQLNERKYDPAGCIKKSIFGIHFSYTEEPTAENPYPEVYIRIAPFIYGAGNTNTPEDIESQIEGSMLFKKELKEYLSEENRLLYVGMTRPRDVMIMALMPPTSKANPLQWLQDVGLNCVKLDDEQDILGVRYNFENATLKEDEIARLEKYYYETENEKMKTRRIPYMKDLCAADQKYVSPSSLNKKGTVVASYNICKRMPLGVLTGRTPADVGNCIHQIYCGIEQNIDNDDYFTKLIDSYGLTKFLIDHAAIKKAWDSLVAWLTDQFGPAKKVYHERPFTLASDGNIYTGSIDLVWQTEKGNVVIDFKTCPMGQEAILTTESSHYAGWYGGQLGAYEKALETAHEKVLKKLIYYPVSGLVCDIV